MLVFFRPETKVLSVSLLAAGVAGGMLACRIGYCRERERRGWSTVDSSAVCSGAKTTSFQLFVEVMAAMVNLYCCEKREREKSSNMRFCVFLS